MKRNIDYYIENLNVLYEDNHLLVCEKFENVLSQKDITNDIDMTEIVSEYLVRKYNKPNRAYVGLIHRLDRRVSGVMVFAKTSKAAARLSEQVKNKEVTKRYLAFVLGNINDEGILKDKLCKDEKKHIAYVSANGKEAVLKYKKIKNITLDSREHSICEVELITGRYNQIRCQMAHHKHPLVNDIKYGYKGNEKGQIGLYCYKMGIFHPITKQYLEFEVKPNKGIWKNL